MFGIIRTEYGREIKAFEFDYLGNHKNLDSIILNAHAKIFENGLYIGSGLSEDYAYLKWDEILEICYIYRKREMLEIKYDKGAILLEKVKEEINIDEFLTLVKEAAPDTKIVRRKCNQDEECDCEIPDESLFELDEQDKRIESILRDIDEDDLIKVMETWEKYLKDKLVFPFECEIIETQESGFLKAGNRIMVIGIDDFDDLYGVVVEVIYKKRNYSFPLCDLEVVDRNSENYIPVDDYSVWFANR